MIERGKGITEVMEIVACVVSWVCGYVICEKGGGSACSAR